MIPGLELRSAGLFGVMASVQFRFSFLGSGFRV